MDTARLKKFAQYARRALLEQVSAKLKLVLAGEADYAWAKAQIAEYGLTERLTLQMKGEWQQGRDAYVDFDGRGAECFPSDPEGEFSGHFDPPP